MKNLTYKQAVSQLEMLEKKVNLYNNLISCGIAEKRVHLYEAPVCESGYSMGELIIIRCNGKEIDRYDNRKEYARSCKWSAKHGKIILDFTKKDLKTYFDLLQDKLNTNGYWARYTEMRDLKTKVFVAEESEVKKFYTF